MSRLNSSNPFHDESQSRSLEARLRERIRLEGPITFREWMQAALYDEREGYYRRPGAERWGRAGDYRTSPERSSLFAATLARHFAELFDELGRPRALYLIEAGGGEGHFAHGVLQTLQRDAPRVLQSLRYIYDESSADSRIRAAGLLAPFAGCVVFQELEEIREPLDAVIVFSNELLDAFPVHRVVMRGGELREMRVGVVGENFVWVESELSMPSIAEHFTLLDVTLSDGQFAEVNFGAEEWMQTAARVVGRGFIVSVDYGDQAEQLFGTMRGHEGTLRGFRGHEFVEDVLSNPGEQDLTTTINWTHISSVGESLGLKTVAHERLDSFLLRAGLIKQLEHETLLAASEAEVARLRLNAREMILPGGMASSFQVLIQKKI